MFESWGRIIYRRRRLVLVLTLIVVAFAGVWGTGVFASLQTAGGFNAPDSQSQHASDLASAAFGRDTSDVVVLYKSARLTVTDPAYRAAVTSTLAALPRSRVESVATFWSTGSRQFVSASGRETYAVLQLTGGSDAARIKSFDAIKGSLAVPGLTEHAGGLIPSEGAINKEVTSDIGRAEGLSMPLLLVLLMVIFGGLAAASLPLAIGGIAILGSFTALRLLTLLTAVSIYSVNITTILGLGLAIDYGLFMVSRFREELGRTAAVSGITVAVALASLMLFPMTFLRSMGYGGVATVIVDMVAALTVMPALLAVLGPRVNALRVRRRRRAGAARQPGAALLPGAVPADETSGAWYRLARSVMRRPVVYVVVIVAGLAAVGSPFLH